MNFTPELAEKVMAGVKTQTRRLPSANPRSPWYREACGYEVGQTVAVCPGRGEPSMGRIEIAAVDFVRLDTITDDDARAEGLASVETAYPLN